MRRNKSIQLFSCLLAIVAMGLVSCQQNNKSGKEETEITETHFTFDSLHINKDVDGIATIDYDFHFLKAESIVADSINAKINEQCISGTHDKDISKAIATTIDKELETFRAELVEFYEPDDETYGDMKFHISRKGHFLDNAADTVIIYQYTIDQYTGGAHGSYIPFTLNFSKRTGLSIGIEDVLDITHEEAILDIMLTKLLKDNNCATREELMEKTGILGLGDLYLTENFHLGEDSITFCFGQYDIAPYSSGITYLSLSYDSLKQYLKTK
ncbi:MAG: DUF3298 domain-containing protein [Bacteroidaceae bacterium]|jgi:hypothetical protein|nr:DUF3298 domain-containing protein [Bacteroidaceae bacterium]